MSTTPATVPEHGRAADTAPVSSARDTAVGIVRVLLGMVFLWTFLDKTFGLYGTTSSESWLAGHSPTSGYLGSIEGPLAGTFHAMSGQWWVDVLFMGGMGLVGTALVLGVAMRLAAIGAVALMGSLYLTSLPLDNNPIVDQHLIYATLAVALAAVHAGDVLGLGRWWAKTPLGQRSPWLR